MLPSTKLGPFEIRAPLGQGGMGTVWRAVHVGPAGERQRARQAEGADERSPASAKAGLDAHLSRSDKSWLGRTVGHPVAVKVLTAELTRRPAYQAAFRNEVRAVAGLDHPCVVRVFDHGIAEGPHEAGAPWLAMELAPRGTLDSAAPGLGWDGVRAALLAILDGLAHAHARGVVHRDLKPANVLRWGDDDWRIADFGIAHARSQERDDVIERASGTPLYMAPEQVRGALREQGPWTDLYALGCVAWQLVTGAPPFRGGSADLARAHLLAEVPRLVPRIAVPVDLEAWVRRLLAKSPEERFRTSADAALALSGLGGVADGAVVGAEASPQDATTAVDLDVWPVEVVSGAPPPDPLPVARAPLPVDWRVRERTPDPELLGVGLGLYGLRQAPLVGREAERDRLWALLREAAGVADTAIEVGGGQRVAVVAGPAGVGKSRLARWLTERAAECGATVLTATHAVVEGPADGLGAMVARYLRVDGLPRAAVERALGQAGAVERAFGPAGAAELADLVAPIGPVAASVRFARIERLLAAIGGPVVVWLDDVQWSADALGLAAWLTEGRFAAPVLVVATVREEALPERPVEAEALERLDAVRIALGPLDEAHRNELIGALLHLEGDVAARVAERTAGNPLFAVQLVGDWVGRGLLEVGRHGFRVAPGADLELPADLGAVWAARIARCVPDAALPSVEIAAVLGQEVDTAEWREACEIAGVTASDAVLEVLLDQRLARSDAPGRSWSFVHGMLRESLLGRARARLSGWHAVCAAMLARRATGGGGGDPMIPERLGRHLIGAGRHEEAIDPLFDAAFHRALRGEYGASEALYADREDAMRISGVPASDERWGQGWFRRATIARNRGRLDEAEAWSERTIEAGERHGWRRSVADALVTRALVASLRGEGSRAWPWLDRALTLLPEGADQARARLVVGEILLSERRFDEARAAFEAALQADRDVVVAEAWRFLGHLGLRTGRMDEAAAALDRAADLYERLGDPSGVGNCTNDRAAISHVLGRYEEAAEGYRRAIRVLCGMGALADASAAQLNLAVVLVLLGREAEAAEQAMALRPRLLRAGRVALAGLTDLVLAACDVEADERLEAAIVTLTENGYRDEDVVLLARRVAERAAATGALARAERALALVEAQGG